MRLGETARCCRGTVEDNHRHHSLSIRWGPSVAFAGSCIAVIAVVAAAALGYWKQPSLLLYLP